MHVVVVSDGGAGGGREEGGREAAARHRDLRPRKEFCAESRNHGKVGGFRVVSTLLSHVCQFINESTNDSRPKLRRVNGPTTTKSCTPLKI